MKAEIKEFHSPDVDDLASWRPETESFQVFIQLLIGTKGERGEEAFNLLVCSPSWLAEEVRKVGVVDGRHMFVVDTWNWPVISRYFRRRVTNVEAEDWDSLALILGRIGMWEYEDYKEYVPD